MPNVTKNVEIYSTPSCHFCHMAKDFFTEHNIPFTNFDVSVDAEKRNEMIHQNRRNPHDSTDFGDRRHMPPHEGDRPPYFENDSAKSKENIEKVVK